MTDGQAVPLPADCDEYLTRPCFCGPACCPHCPHSTARPAPQPGDTMNDTTDESCDHMWNDSDHCIDCGAEIDHHLGCPADPDPDYEAEAQARGLAPHGKLLAVDAEGADDTLRVVALQAARDVRYEIDDWDDTWDETALAVLGAVMNEYEQRIASAVATEFCRIRKLATDSGAIYRTGSNGSRHFAPFADLMDNSGAEQQKAWAAR